MTEMVARRVENYSEKPWEAGFDGNEKTSENAGVYFKQEEEENISSCQETSPKSRRKISKPKHYKPTTNGEGDNGEHNGTSEGSNGSASSPESVVPDEGDKVVPEDAVHVMTASRATKKGPSPQSKRVVNSQKPKRPPTNKAPAATNKAPAASKKQKHEAPTVPRKPEDLIKEAMMRGKQASPASKRDAQYRKSYAYKIWKERGSQEVISDPVGERNGTSAAKTKLPPGHLQNKARAAFYWPAHQYNGTTPPGFFANGQYYAVTPQMIPTIHGRPQVSPTSPTISQVRQDAVTVATSVRTLPSSVIQSSTAGVVSPSQQRVPFPATVRSSSFENGKRVAKVIPPNVVVVPQYPSKESLSPRSPIKTPPLSKTPTKAACPVPNYQVDTAKAPSFRRTSQAQLPISHNLENGFPTKKSEKGFSAEKGFPTENGFSAENGLPVENGFPTKNGWPAENDFPAKNSETGFRAKNSETRAKTSEAVETKASNVSTSPSNLVSLMKSSLRQKHSKENVQPLPNLFKTKRKLETDKSDGPPAKKSGKPTIFTPLNEQEAEKLANDIYDVNLEYFPFQTLAEKAAQSEETLPETPERSEKTNKVKEIEKVRCLLKDFYDVTFSCTEDPDMQKFDSASRKFGRKNILNHLSLLDRYFDELQKKLDT